MSYEDLALDQIDRNPGQPRKHFDEEALAELAVSIKALGLLEPIIVRPVDGRFLIIAGERRWRAAAVAGCTTVPCRVLDVDEATAFELSVAENVNRHDMTPIEEAQAYRTLQGFGRDVDAISSLFGKTKKYVNLRLTLLDLTDELQEQVGAGRIAISVAQMTARLNPANQQAMLFKLMKGTFVNDNEALHMAYAMLQAEGQTSMFDVEEPDEAEREKRVKAKRQVKTLLDQTERLTEVLSELAALKPEDYAAVGLDCRKTLARLDRMGRYITKARFNARQGGAIAVARNAVSEVNPDAAAS